MKKTVIFSLFLVCIFFTLTATQCGKDYICQCEGGLTGKPEPVLLQETTRKKAEKDCNSYNTPPGTPDGYYNCRLQ